MKLSGSEDRCNVPFSFYGSLLPFSKVKKQLSLLFQHEHKLLNNVFTWKVFPFHFRTWSPQRRERKKDRSNFLPSVFKGFNFPLEELYLLHRCNNFPTDWLRCCYLYNWCTYSKGALTCTLYKSVLCDLPLVIISGPLFAAQWLWLGLAVLCALFFFFF